MYVTCVDIDECELGLDDCDDQRVADCVNTNGSFSCTCKIGYTGSGRNGTCEGKLSSKYVVIDNNNNIYIFPTDIDECAMDTHSCDQDAMCTNAEGSFTCACYPGSTGDGLSCCKCAKDTSLAMYTLGCM